MNNNVSVTKQREREFEKYEKKKRNWRAHEPTKLDTYSHLNDFNYLIVTMMYFDCYFILQ